MLKKLKRFLYLFHRWLGVGLCLWFALLFATGIIMMYVEYPELTEEERLWQMPTLRASAIGTGPDEAALAAGHDEFSAIRLNSVLGRPAYHLTDAFGRTTIVFADDGTVLAGITEQEAMVAARASGFAAGGATPRHTGVIEVDQWTVSSSLHPHRPLHRIALDDAADTVLYISSTSGQVVRDTNAPERFWNWLGSTIHWIYPWQLRQHTDLWVDIIVYLSVAGMLSIISGAVVGWWRLRVRRRYRGERMTPYRGWQKWHHVLGLGFLVFITTWMFSGLMSMSPWGVFDNATSPAQPISRYYGGALDTLAEFPAVGAAIAASTVPVKEVEWRRIGETRYLVLAHGADDKQLALPHHGNHGAALRTLVEEAVPRLLPQTTIVATREISTYDTWYYSHHNRYRPLPALEVRFDDAEQSWYYVDLTTGAVVQRLTTTDRWARWLYNGLHSLDFAPLFQSRPVWDFVVILLSLCGLAFSVTSVVIGWRRLRGA